MNCPNCKNEINKSYIDSIPWVINVTSYPVIKSSDLIIHTKVIHCDSCNKDIAISAEYPLVNVDQVKIKILWKLEVNKKWKVLSYI